MIPVTTLQVPTRVRLVSELEVSALLERVEHVKREYQPKTGWLVSEREEKEKRDGRA